MIYTRTIVSIKGGSAGAPSRDIIFLTQGLVYQFDLYFPPGSCGWMHVYVEQGGYRVWPSEPDQDFFGDNCLITFPDRYFIESKDTALFIYHYNLDDTYDHRFQVRIGQVSAELFIASYLPGYGQKDIASVILELQAAQAQESEEKQAALIEYFSGPGAVVTEEGSD